MRVLLAGESWVTHSVHVKGVDSFDTSTYVEGAGRLIEALEAAQIEVDYLPAHLVPARFPATPADLGAYGAVILSDIGANSLLLAPDTFERSAAAPNRLASVEQYVRDSGGLLMIGGYLSFAGIEGKARYHHTPVESALPVTISPHDDRAERPEGVHPAVTEPGHPVLAAASPPPRSWSAATPTPSWSWAATAPAAAPPSPRTAPRTGARPPSWPGPATTPSGATCSTGCAASDARARHARSL